MRKSNFLDKYEWEKIVEDAFASTESHAFSQEYQAKKNEIQRRMIMEKKNNAPRRKYITAVASIVAVAVLVPTSVFAYNRITGGIEKTAPYQNTVKLEGISDVSNEDLKLSKGEKSDVGYMMYEMEYIPEGYTFDQPPYNGKYHNFENNGGISCSFYRIPDDINDFKYDMRFSEKCENYECDGKTVMINYRLSYGKGNEGESNFGREVWVSFSGTRYLLQLYVTDEISEKELYKIIDNVSLYKTNEKMYEEDFSWLEDEKGKDINIDPKLNAYAVPIEKANVLKVGDTAEYNIDSVYNFSFTLNGLEILDNFDGITTDCCGLEADFSNLMDAGGIILPNTRTWYKIGDGVNTFDEDIYSYDMPYHILKINVTVTNKSVQYQECCICPDILNFRSDGVPDQFEEDLRIPKGFDGNEVFYRDSVFDRYSHEAFFSFNTDEAHMGSKNYVNLNAGESADFEVCFLLSENRLHNNPYLSFYCIGNTYSEYISNGNPIFKLDVK